MAFCTFTTKEEFMSIVYSVHDTLQFEADFSDVAMRLVESFGFVKVIDSANRIRGGSFKGITYKLIEPETDVTVYVSFSNPAVSGTGASYMFNKHFVSTSKNVYHRDDSKPAYISYHGNGKVFEEHYIVNGAVPPVVLIDDVEYSYLSKIQSTKHTKDYTFSKQQWHAVKYKVNLKTMTPLQVIYFNEDFPGQFIEFFQLKKLYPDVGRLKGLDRINLNKSLTSSELALLDMIVF